MTSQHTAVLIGPVIDCVRLERQLDLLPGRPVTLGWIVTDRAPEAAMDRLAVQLPLLGRVEDLEVILGRRRPAVALVTMPAVFSERVQSIRTRLRRMGIPDRFIPTLRDLLDGVGPRTELTIDPAALLDRRPCEVDEASIRSAIDGRVVAITGAGGSIGSELARIVARYAPARLILIDRSEGALFDIDRQVARIAPQLPRTALLHDVVDAPATLEHFRRWRPDVVFHAAAHKHVPMMEDHPAAAVDNNLFGTVSTVDAAIAVGAERFVMISTDKAVNPTSIMGATKRLAELYVQSVNEQSDTGCAIVRFGNVLGSSGSALEIWTRQVAEGGPVTVTDPAMTRYFMTIPEAASLVIQSCALLDMHCTTGEVFVLDMGEPVRVLDMAKRLVAAYGLEAQVPGTLRGAAGTMTGARATDADESMDTEALRLDNACARDGERGAGPGGNRGARCVGTRSAAAGGGNPGAHGRGAMKPGRRSSPPCTEARNGVMRERHQRADDPRQEGAGHARVEGEITALDWIRGGDESGSWSVSSSRASGGRHDACTGADDNSFDTRWANGVIDIVFTGIRPGEKLYEELALDTECMRPTAHPGIHRWILPAPSSEMVATILKRLDPRKRPTGREELARLIRSLVPELAQAVAA